jgi:hypothetical protein
MEDPFYLNGFTLLAYGVVVLPVAVLPALLPAVLPLASPPAIAWSSALFITGESMLSGVPSVPAPLSLPPPQPAIPAKAITPKTAHFPQRDICISLLLNWIRRTQKQLLCLITS